VDGGRNDLPAKCVYGHVERGDGCLHKGDCGVEITCLYTVILAAPVTNRQWIGRGIGLDLVGEVGLHVPAGHLVC
jgi:hypothetical protein